MSRVQIAFLVIVVGLTACGKSVELPELVAEAPYAADTGTLLIHCGALIDGVSDEMTGPTYVLVEDGHIKLLAADVKAATGIATPDLSDRTCLPGFVDMHTHIMESVDDLTNLRAVYGHSFDDVMNTGRRIAKITLGSGFTTVRNVGVYFGWMGRELRDDINAGESIGPRMQVAGFYLTIPSGGGDLIIPDQWTSSLATG